MKHPINEHPLILKYIRSNSYGKLLGMHFTILEPGVLDYFIKIGSQHLATPHAAHGGLISSLADGAQGVCALSAVCADNQVVSTLQLNIQFLSGPSIGDELVAKATITKRGKRIAFTRCEIFNRTKNEMVAISTATFNIYPAEKAGY
ncbi:MAG: PaaI family thioesterase [Bacteroidia bacterium]|nr:PaaI family thioesterase [Bacteroidia bacterium]